VYSWEGESCKEHPAVSSSWLLSGGDLPDQAHIGNGVADVDVDVVKHRKTEEKLEENMKRLNGDRLGKPPRRTVEQGELWLE
jgi:hypothetical protein